MWKFGLVIVLISCGVNGQEQFLREVKNPSGPSQIILRGGALNSNRDADFQALSSPEQGGQQVEERYVLADQQEGPIPLQSPQETPIPEDGGEYNPFTNGEAGFGLRYTQPRPQVQQQPQVQQGRPAPPSSPQVVQQQQQPGQIVLEEPVPIDQPAPIVYQKEITLPNLPQGQQYVDVYGRPIVLEQQPPQIIHQPVQVQAAPVPPVNQSVPPVQQYVDIYGNPISLEQQPHKLVQQAVQPAPLPQVNQSVLPVQQYVDVYGNPVALEHQPPQVVQQTIQAAPVPLVNHSVPPALQQVFVDQFGRQLTHLQTQPQFLQQEVLHHEAVPVAQQLVQHSEVPVAHHVVQHTEVPVAHQVFQPAVQHVLQPASVAIPVAKKKVVSHSPLTLHTYAVPAVRKIKGLTIPYAQKIVLAKSLEDFVYPPTVSAHAIVKSRHRSVVIPQKVKVLSPAVQEVHHIAPAVQEVHAVQNTLVDANGQALYHHPQQFAVAHHQPQQLLHLEQPSHVITQQHHELVHVEQPVAHAVVHHQPQAVLQHAPAATVVEKHLVHSSPPVVLKKVKPLVPEVTLIHQPVLPPVQFQKHIFNVKHGSEPIIFQDLCTVYPYQKNLRACVLKKAILPELHHPDIRTINVEESRTQAQPQPDQSIVAGGSPVVVPAPATPSSSVTVTKALPQNIQEAIRRESAKSKANAQAAAAATAKETEVNSPQPDAAESRESSSSSGKRKSRRKKNRGSSSSSHASTEKPFKLA